MDAPPNFFTHTEARLDALAAQVRQHDERLTQIVETIDALWAINARILNNLDHCTRIIERVARGETTTAGRAPTPGQHEYVGNAQQHEPCRICQRHPFATEHA